MAIPPPTVQIQKKRGWGCWGCGCAVLVVIALLIVGFIAAGSYYGYHAARNLTDVTSTEIPQFDGGDVVYRAASQKVTDFEEALEQNQPGTLRLNSDEINTIIAHDPAYAKVRGHLFVKLEGSDAHVQASLPLGSFEKVVFTDRYLNGTAVFGISFDPADKNVNFDLHGMNIKGTDIPPNASSSLSQSLNTNLNARLQANPTARDFLNRTKNITVENGELVIETK